MHWIYLTSLFFISVVGYNESISKQAVLLAQLAYCPNEKLDIEYIDIENYGSKAILGYDNYTEMIFISFRGSSNTHNWMENIQMNQISPYENPNIKVEKGFYKNYNFVKNPIFDMLPELSDKYSCNKLFITGHSLGSAAATLFAFDILLHYKYTIKYFYNFGSPRVGNDVFVYIFNQMVKGFRVVHNNDIVTSVPPVIFDYAHISTGIYYNEDNSKYSKTEPESKDYSINDHLNYLNVTMGSSGC